MKTREGEMSHFPLEKKKGRFRWSVGKDARMVMPCERLRFKSSTERWRKLTSDRVDGPKGVSYLQESAQRQRVRLIPGPAVGQPTRDLSQRVTSP